MLVQPPSPTRTSFTAVVELNETYWVNDLLHPALASRWCCISDTISPPEDGAVVQTPCIGKQMTLQYHGEQHTLPNVWVPLAVVGAAIAVCSLLCIAEVRSERCWDCSGERLEPLSGFYCYTGHIALQHGTPRAGSKCTVCTCKNAQQIQQKGQ